MGGYGALYLAGVLRARAVAVAVAESPAIWHHSYQSVEGAFDDAADFDRARRSSAGSAGCAGIALRIDCGARDGFAPVDPRPAGEHLPHPGRRHRAGRARLGLLALARRRPSCAFVGRHLDRLTTPRAYSAPTASRTSSLTSKFA